MTQLGDVLANSPDYLHADQLDACSALALVTTKPFIYYSFIESL